MRTTLILRLEIIIRWRRERTERIRNKKSEQKSINLL